MELSAQLVQFINQLSSELIYNVTVAAVSSCAVGFGLIGVVLIVLWFIFFGTRDSRCRKCPFLAAATDPAATRTDPAATRTDPAVTRTDPAPPAG